jgi:hypothetical protein
MAAISSTAAGGNYSDPASWVGGVVPTVGALDDVTIVGTATITVDTTGLTCRTLTINTGGILKASRVASNILTVGNALSDTVITNNGFIDYGTDADIIPSPIVAQLLFNPLNSTVTTSQSNLTSTNTSASSGISAVGDRNWSGKLITITDPETGIVYNTTQCWSPVTADIAAAAVSCTLTENLNLRVGERFVLIGSNTTNGNSAGQTEIKTVTSYAANVVGFAAASFGHIRNQLLDGATVVSELKVVAPSNNVIFGAVGGKYWGYTLAASATPILTLKHCSFLSSFGNVNSFTQTNDRVFVGVYFQGMSTGTAQAMRGQIRFINCTFESCRLSGGLFNAKHVNCFIYASPINGIDMFTSQGGYCYNCIFASINQAIVNAGGTYVYRSEFFHITSGVASSTTCYLEDCIWNRIDAPIVGSSGSILVRGIYGNRNYTSSNSQGQMYFDTPKFLTSEAVAIQRSLNSPTYLSGQGYIAGFQTPTGASATTNIGILTNSGGVLTGYTTATSPESVTPVPSGSTIVNKLVTQPSIEFASSTAFTCRPVSIVYKIPCTASATFLTSVALRSISAWSQTALAKIEIRLVLADGQAITTNVPSLAANVWQSFSVTGISATTGTATITVYIQANVGNLYIDYPPQMISAGYGWSGGLPTINQSPLISAGLVNDITTAVVARGNDIADQVWRRATSGIEGSSYGDAISLKSPYGMVAQGIHNTSSNPAGTTLTVTKSDDTTVLGTRALTTDAAALPITGINSN